MTQEPLTLRITVAWWFTPYIHVLTFFCFVMQQEPDWEKLERVCIRALKVRRG